MKEEIESGTFQMEKVVSHSLYRRTKNKEVFGWIYGKTSQYRHRKEKVADGYIGGYKSAI